MLRNLLGILLFPVVVVSAYYLNKFLVKMLRPRESGGRFLLYMLVCFFFGFVYAYLGTLVVLRIVLHK